MVAPELGATMDFLIDSRMDYRTCLKCLRMNTILPDDGVVKQRDNDSDDDGSWFQIRYGVYKTLRLACSLFKLPLKI